MSRTYAMTAVPGDLKRRNRFGVLRRIPQPIAVLLSDICTRLLSLSAAQLSDVDHCMFTTLTRCRSWQ